MNIIFGPVASRRLGRSLGVNVIPEKICSLDCVYCEMGKTKTKTIKRAPYISAETIITAFIEQYPKLMDKIDVVTITGNGEPTLNSELDKIIDGIKAISQHPVCVLTNSTLLAEQTVFNALLKADIVVPSLDAATAQAFANVDKPHNDLDVNHIIAALAKFSCTFLSDNNFSKKLYLELLLVKGLNDGIAELNAFANVAKQICCTKIQLGTVFRPPAYSGVERLSDDELTQVYLHLSKKGLDVEPVGAFTRKVSENSTLEEEKELLINLLHMRPVTMEDISVGLGISHEHALTLILNIENDYKIVRRQHSDEEYLSITKILS